MKRSSLQVAATELGKKTAYDRFLDGTTDGMAGGPTLVLGLRGPAGAPA